MLVLQRFNVSDTGMSPIGAKENFNAKSLPPPFNGLSGGRLVSWTHHEFSHGSRSGRIGAGGCDS
jgi:hypothetical protein